uniref:Uncharacterized protein n=1 Tax=Sphaerodactylus townsendi TaxID=933632 RepID=A0ACB8FFT6_9SAUR
MVERFRLTTFLAESQEPEQGATREMDKQCRAYAALQLRSSELSKERDQLRADLSTLQRQVASLMAGRDQEQSLQTMSPLAGYITETMASSPTTRRASYPTSLPQAHLNAARRPRRSFKVNFNGDPDELALFLIQASSYMEVHGAGFWTDREQVFELGTHLRGEAANWLVGLVEGDAPELYDLEQFLLALRWRFEDPLTEERARAALRRLCQGTRSVSDFATEFCRLTSRLRGWPEMVLYAYQTVLPILPSE